MGMMNLVYATTAAVAVYVIVLRPVLRKVPALTRYYASADTIREKLFALAWRSVTVVWGYIVILATSAWKLLDVAFTSLNDSDLKQQISAFFVDYGPEITMCVSVIFIIARLRSVAAHEG